MLTLKLTVPHDRDCCAVATLMDNDHKVLHRDFAVASASLVQGARHGNADCDTHKPWGHPPWGVYHCLGRTQATPAQTNEYGAVLFVLRGEYGAAALSGMYGRPAFLAYSGAAGADGWMRRTQGGFRLTDAMIAALLGALTQSDQPPDGARFSIRLEEAEPPPVWQFWKRKIETPPLSATEPAQLATPDDEPSLAAALLKQLTAQTRHGYGDASSADSPQASPHAEASQEPSSSFNHPSGTRSTGESPRHDGESGGGGASGDWGSSGSSSNSDSGSSGSSSSSQGD